MIFPDIEHACAAAMILKQQPVSSAELMDRASLRSVEHRSGLPSCIASLPPDAAALLVEVRAGDHGTLVSQSEQIIDALAPVPTMFPLSFTDRKEEYEILWDVRRGLFPAVGGSRKIGTTVVIEDVVFPLENLAGATVELESLMRKHGYDDGIIFGHALDGNLHFVFTQDFGSPGEVRRYARLMDEVTAMVVKKYDGSLKGEHGTGRNMAPFVAFEWGEQAYGLMQRIKNAFDPGHLLNPGVIINENHHAHLENLKPLPKTHEIVDKCIECGFCEAKCPSRELTTTPRQRIVIQREISRLRSTGENAERMALLEQEYHYFGEQTCATDGLCATACPVSINTGDLTKYLRSRKHSRFSGLAARWVAGHYPTVLSGVRLGLNTAAGLHSMLGTSIMDSISKGLRSLSQNALPLWNSALPKGVPEPRLRDFITGSLRKVVYFPSCIVRTMGPARNDRDQRPVFEAMLSVLSKAGYDVLFPEEMEKLCCGMPFESKGFFTQADQLARELEAALIARSKGGEYPVLCDTSPCLHRMRRAFRSELRLYEPVEFIHDFLMDHLAFRRTSETVAVHVTCSATRMGLTGKFRALAQACADKVILPPGVGCCGFAGDRGFTHPELNAAALAELKPSLPRDCTSGYSNSRTCEIGLSLRSGVEYQSIVYLVDRCAARRTELPK
jgi:D-lactate dehydrogenase